jgi:hypothetical protein
MPRLGGRLQFEGRALVASDGGARRAFNDSPPLKATTGSGRSPFSTRSSPASTPGVPRTSCPRADALALTGDVL